MTPSILTILPPVVLRWAFVGRVSLQGAEKKYYRGSFRDGELAVDAVFESGCVIRSACHREREEQGKQEEQEEQGGSRGAERRRWEYVAEGRRTEGEQRGM